MTHSLRLVWRSLLVLFVAMGFAAWAQPEPDQSPSSRKPSPELERQLKSFVATKRQQAETILTNANLAKPEQLDGLFSVMASNDSRSASNRYEAFDRQFRNRQTDSEELGVVWQIVMEAHTGWDAFRTGDPALMERFGREIIGAVPEGAVYFGGTDAGRFVVTALCESHAEARPFFTLTQNQLADARYMAYLRHTYGSRLSIPGKDGVSRAMEDYVADYQKRKEQDKVAPDEQMSIDSEGRMTVSGVGSVMAINGLLVKQIMQRNPDREYFMEESFPIASLYPHLEPAGPILRIRAEPVGALGEETVRNDRQYWKKLCGDLIGDWIEEETSVQEVCSFAIERYLRKQVQGFTGSVNYVQDPNAPKAFSKLRSAIASVYNWHAENADNENDRRRMLREADLGFRQALALCPYSPEAIWRYHTLLTSQGKTDEAGLVLQTAQKFAPQDPQLREWLRGSQYGR